MRHLLLFLIAACVVSTPALAGKVDSSVIDEIIANFDLTSFPNSVGPRRKPEKTTFSDYGFIDVEKTSTGATLKEADGSWEMSFRILSVYNETMRMCFYDNALGKPEQIRKPSYHSTSALRVTKGSQGEWIAEQVDAGFPGCQNDPAA